MGPLFKILESPYDLGTVILPKAAGLQELLVEVASSKIERRMIEPDFRWECLNWPPFNDELKNH